MSLNYTILLHSFRQFLLSAKEFRELWIDRSYFLSLQNNELDPTPHIHANLFSKFDSSTKTKLQDWSSVIPMYRACSFPVLKLYPNITTYLHISHTCNFLPAVTRRHQGLENLTERDRTRGWSFLQEHPGWSPAAPREGAAIPAARCLRIRLPLTSVKCANPPRKQKAAYCFSPLCSLLATTRKNSIHHFSIRMIYIFPFYYAQPWSYHRVRGIGKKSLSAGFSPSMSPVWFFWIYF